MLVPLVLSLGLAPAYLVLATPLVFPRSLAQRDSNSSHYGPLYPGLSSNNHTCFLESPILSCSGEADGRGELVDTCCVETFGGLGLVTQFWDTYTGLEDQGQLLPKNNWTLHGYWPDFCNGSYTGYCDLLRQFDSDPSPPTLEDGTKVPPYDGPGITQILKEFGRYDLLDYMNTYWVSRGSPNEDFWAHEFSKHGTCYSTFQTACYGPKYVKNEDVIDFFDMAIRAYQEVPTYEWLAANNIVPSNSTRYTYSDIENALTEAYGAKPYIGCTDDNMIDQVWYYRHFYGRPQDLVYKVTDSTTDSSCSKDQGAILYPEQSTGSVR